MGKALAALLSLILLVNLFGNFISFIAERYTLRQQREHLRISDAQKFEFTISEFQQLDKRDGDKEFFMNGKMFDILETKFSGNKVLLLAYFDHEETNLLDKFLSFFETESSSNTGKSNKILSFVLSEFIGADGVISIFSIVRTFSLTPTVSKLLLCPQTKQSPPPDLF